ncbi:MAG: hypothetical protein HWD61_06625 [Parachlamydiaceae bacterium]|nr:MAG: hypothetical protein HWD61_06625 [Parachlamydiaceae bacterium]
MKDIIKFYITSNEYNQEASLRSLQIQSKNYEGKVKAHLGVACTFNLRIGLSTHADEIILTDANPVMVEVNKR